MTDEIALAADGAARRAEGRIDAGALARPGPRPGLVDADGVPLPCRIDRGAEGTPAEVSVDTVREWEGQESVRISTDGATSITMSTARASPA